MKEEAHIARLHNLEKATLDEGRPIPKETFPPKWMFKLEGSHKEGVCRNWHTRHGPSGWNIKSSTTTQIPTPIHNRIKNGTRGWCMEREYPNIRSRRRDTNTPKLIHNIGGWPPVPTLKVPLETGMEDEMFNNMFGIPNVNGLEEKGTDWASMHNNPKEEVVAWFDN